MNLRLILDHFGISYKAVADALNVHATQVSRWASGDRQLRVSAQAMEPLADFILSRDLVPEDLAWMRKAFARDGFDTEFTSMQHVKRCLILWLACDGRDIKRIFWSQHDASGKTMADGRAQTENDDAYLYSIGPAGRIYEQDYTTKAGVVDIALRMRCVLDTLEPGTVVDICLSSESMSAVVHKAFVEAVTTAAARDIRFRLLLSVSSNSSALSRILTTYMQIIVTSNMQVSVIHGVMQPMLNQMLVLVPRTCAAILSEVPDSHAPLAGLFITEETFLKDFEKHFEHIVRFAQPIFTSFTDKFSQHIIEVFYQEFVEAGNLDILKDSINPLYMSEEGYNAVLRTRGHKGEALQWRSEQFHRFKTGMDKNLSSGTVFREMIPMKRLKQIVADRCARMPGVYFMENGIVFLDRDGCIDLLRGYIDYMETTPTFNLMIVNEIAVLNEHSCWHMKQNQHISINTWERDEPSMIYSDQLIMTHEFQTQFNELWMQEGYSVGARQRTIRTLQTLVEALERD